MARCRFGAAHARRLSGPGSDKGPQTVGAVRRDHAAEPHCPLGLVAEFLAHDSHDDGILTALEASGLLVQDGVVRGVRYRSEDGTEGEIRALLTVGADGRSSATRQAAGLPLLETSSGTNADLIETTLRLPSRPTGVDVYIVPSGGAP